MIRAAACLLLAVSTSACFLSRQTDNEPLSDRELRSLVPGKTTTAEAVERLGAPTDVVQLGKRSAYLYSQSTAKTASLFLVVINLSNVDRRSDRAWLFFDEHGVLTHLGDTLAAARSSYAMPWFSLYEGEGIEH